MSKSFTQFLIESEGTHKMSHDMQKIASTLGAVETHIERKSGSHSTIIVPHSSEPRMSAKILKHHGFEFTGSSHSDDPSETSGYHNFHHFNKKIGASATIHSHFNHDTGEHHLRIYLEK